MTRPLLFLTIWAIVLRIASLFIHSNPKYISIALALIYVGILSSVVAFLAWNKAITLIGPSRTALIYYLIPVFSGIAAWLLLGEVITGLHIFSMLLIIFGIILTNR